MNEIEQLITGVQFCDPYENESQVGKLRYLEWALQQYDQKTFFLHFQILKKKFLINMSLTFLISHIR